MLESCPAVRQLRQQPLWSSSGRQPAWRPSRKPPAAQCRPLPRAAALGDEPASSGSQPAQMQFTYMDEARAAEAEAALQAARAAGLAEYAELKEFLLFRTWRFGLLFSGYLLLSVSGEAAVAELVGAAASYGYLRWLMWDVDRIQPGDRMAWREAEAVDQPALRLLAKGLAAYSHALRPRLLVLCALVGACTAVNATDPADPPLGLVEIGCAVGGFLSYKVALLLKLYDDLKPKPKSAEELMRPRRPTLPDLPGADVSLDFLSSSAKQQAQAQQQETQQQQAQEE